MEEVMSLFSAKQTAELNVKGMHCEKCVARVTEALENVEGVTEARVDLESESAAVEGHGFEAASLVSAIEEAGFEAAIK